jgi:hypothetical protein
MEQGLAEDVMVAQLVGVLESVGLKLSEGCTTVDSPASHSVAAWPTMRLGALLPLHAFSSRLSSNGALVGIFSSGFSHLFFLSTP